jgi:excisionase family DNA binding protein
MFNYDVQSTTMPEPTYAPAKQTYYKRPSPLLQQMQRALDVRNQAAADPLLTTGEVMTLIRCSYSHLRHLIRSKELAIWRPHPRAHVRVRQSEVMRYLESGNHV